MKDSNFITLFLCGDVMTGRGIDQMLPNPGDPVLHESQCKNAKEYLKLAEIKNGQIPKPADFSYIWEETAEVMNKILPDLRIINLETSITKSNNFAKGKPIHYRMHPDNIFSLSAAKIDVCTLANNHILDWGYEGLFETLKSLEKVNIGFAGAGYNLYEAELPAEKNINGKGRVIVFSFCLPSSGVPISWSAEKSKPGVNLISNLSGQTVQQIRKKVGLVKKSGDIVIASIHWGNNWGYHITYKQRKFAHSLIDHADVDIIYGHSSHHPGPVEVYKDKLIIYGTGDLINDYEGIRKNRKFRIELRKLKHFWKFLKLKEKIYFRSDLVLMYFVSVEPFSGKLKNLMAVPMQIKKFRLNQPSRKDAEWLLERMNKVYRKFNLRLEYKPFEKSDKENNIFLFQYVK